MRISHHSRTGSDVASNPENLEISRLLFLKNPLLLIYLEPPKNILPTLSPLKPSSHTHHLFRRPSDRMPKLRSSHTLHLNQVSILRYNIEAQKQCSQYSQYFRKRKEASRAEVLSSTKREIRSLLLALYRFCLLTCRTFGSACMNLVMSKSFAFGPQISVDRCDGPEGIWRSAPALRR
jgi:hypothetical protein